MKTFTWIFVLYDVRVWFGGVVFHTLVSRFTPEFSIGHAVRKVAAGNGTRPIKAPVTRMAIFFRIFFILKSKRFHDQTTVLNERKHLKMVI